MSHWCNCSSCGQPNFLVVSLAGVARSFSDNHSDSVKHDFLNHLNVDRSLDSTNINQYPNSRICNLTKPTMKIYKVTGTKIQLSKKKTELNTSIVNIDIKIR